MCRCRKGTAETKWPPDAGRRRLRYRDRPSPIVPRDVQLTPVILSNTPLNNFIVVENHIVLRISSANPSLYRCLRYPCWGRVVTVPDTACKSQPLLIISSGQNPAFSWCSVKIIYWIEGKTVRPRMDFHLSGVIPRTFLSCVVLIFGLSCRHTVSTPISQQECMCLFLFLSWVAKTHHNYWTMRVGST